MLRRSSATTRRCFITTRERACSGSGSRSTIGSTGSLASRDPWSVLRLRRHCRNHECPEAGGRTLVQALIALVPAGILLSGSLVRVWRGRTVSSYFQLIGSGCLVVVVLTHVFEALDMVPVDGMGAQAKRRTLRRPGERSAGCRTLSPGLLTRCAQEELKPAAGSQPGGLFRTAEPRSR